MRMNSAKSKTLLDGPGNRRVSGGRYGGVAVPPRR